MSADADPVSPPLLLVYGATGNTGLPLVSKALQDGLRVRVFVRQPDKLPESIATNPNLQVSKGDLTDMNAVASALDGVTYAICVAGGKALSAQNGMRKAVEAIIEAMPRYGVTRFLYQAGALSPMPGQQLPFTLKVLRTVLGALLGANDMLKDNDAVLEALCASRDIRWVAVRPGFIRDGQSKGKLKETAKGGASVMYVDMAEFNLAAVQTDTYEKKGVYLSY